MGSGKNSENIMEMPANDDDDDAGDISSRRRRLLYFFLGSPIIFINLKRFFIISGEIKKCLHSIASHRVADRRTRGVSQFSMPLELHHRRQHCDLHLEHDGDENKKKRKGEFQWKLTSFQFVLIDARGALISTINSAINFVSPRVQFLPKNCAQTASQLISKQSIKAAIKQPKK